MTYLTSKQILEKTNMQDLLSVNNINFYDCELEDISMIEKLVNIEIASLSVNKIQSLKVFRNLKKLKELYLRKNLIRSLEEIAFLTDLKDLKILWISENPLCNIPDYRINIIRKLPQLSKLDNLVITPEERQKAKLDIYFDDYGECVDNFNRNLYEKNDYSNKTTVFSEPIRNNNITGEKGSSIGFTLNGLSTAEKIRIINGKKFNNFFYKITFDKVYKKSKSKEKKCVFNSTLENSKKIQGPYKNNHFEKTTPKSSKKSYLENLEFKGFSEILLKGKLIKEKLVKLDKNKEKSLDPFSGVCHLIKELNRKELLIIKSYIEERIV